MPKTGQIAETAQRVNVNINFLTINVNINAGELFALRSIVVYPFQ